MAQRFDDWEGQYLEQSGIPGMKWGVRRYQNKDGSLTAAGRQRYGFGAGEGTKRTSARKMTRDFNRLDKGYANVVADHIANTKRTAKLSRKMHKAERKGNSEKAAKLKKKALAAAEKAALNNKQKKAIEALQWKIIGKAATNGYTTRSHEVTRTGYSTGKRRLAKAIAVGVGGAIGGGVAGGIFGSGAKKVSGQQVKITRKGDGSTKIVNYNEGKKYEQEQRAREAAERRKRYYNR